MKNKKMLSTLLAAILVGTSLAGCGEKPVESQTPVEGNSSVTASTNSENGYTSKSGIPISAPGEFPIVEETYNLDVFIKQLSYGLTDVTTNSFTKELEELTNVHLDMTVATEDAYQEKLNLLLNSGDYPSVVLSGGFTNADLVKYGTSEQILVPLNDMIEEHGVNIKAMWEQFPTWKTDMITPDGNIYGIPSVDSGPKLGHGAVNYKLWLNTSWLDTLGLEIPKSTEDFKKVLTAFKNDDPNGNGQTDEIALTGATGTWAADPYLYLLNAFGYFDENLLMLKDDVFTGVANQDYIKEGLSYIRDLYNEGLIDPSAFTQNDQQLSAIGNNADTVVVGAITCGHVGMAISINDFERMKMYTSLEPLTGPTGYCGIPFAEQRRLSGATFVITDACADPEIAIKFADALCTEEMAVRSNVGLKGVHWDIADADMLGMDGETTAKYKYVSHYENADGTTSNDIWQWTCRLLEPDWKVLFQVEGDIHLASNYEAYLYQETEKLREYAADVQQIPPFYMDEEQSARLSQLSTPLTDYVKSSFVEFITGKKDIEKDWQAYVDGLENLNYTEYIQLYQDAYDALAK